MDTRTQSRPVEYEYRRPEPPRRSSAAVWSAVCGVVGLFFLGWVLGIVAIWMGVRGQRETRTYRRVKGSTLATFGLVLGVVDLVLWTAAAAWFAVWV